VTYQEQHGMHDATAGSAFRAVYPQTGNNPEVISELPTDRPERNGV
jgi:hypothetical protein